MYESQADIQRLQALIDTTHARGGRHLRAIWSDDKKIHAAELPELLTGVVLLALATVAASGAPRVAPVDGLFYQGRFWFGSGPRSARFRHLRARPAVSATHFRGEAFAITVHGNAFEIDTTDRQHEGLVTYCREVYPTWDKWARGAPYAFIEPEQMFTYRHAEK